MDEWLSKIESQPDYNFAIDLVAMMVFRRPQLSPDVEMRIKALVGLRSKFPEIGQQSWDWVQLARRQLANGVYDLLINLLEQVDAGSLNIWEGTEEKTLFQEVIAAAGAGSLDRVLGLAQKGSWRLQMDFRGWLANVYDVNDVVAWIGEDVQRARLVASMTGVSDGPPSELVRYLLSTFGADDEVASSLYGDFVSGSWVGNESERINKQIAQLDSWVASRTEPAGVKNWAKTVIDSLERRRTAVLEQEAEERR